MFLKKANIRTKKQTNQNNLLFINEIGFRMILYWHKFNIQDINYLQLIIVYNSAFVLDVFT